MNPSFLAIFALIFAFLAVGCGVWAVFQALRAASYSSECANWMKANNKRAKIVALESELTEVVDSMASIRESLHKMRSRLAMRERRDQAKEPEKAAYDSTPEGRDAERAALEAELAQSGRLTPKIHLMGNK